MALKRLVLPDPEPDAEYEVNDCARLVEAALSMGYEVEPATVKVAYERFSEAEWAAGWMAIGHYGNTIEQLIRGEYLIVANRRELGTRG